MKLTPRVKLALIAALFALPIVASVVTYVFFPPPPTGNYGELLLPPASAPTELIAMRERWILVAWDRAPCEAACLDKITVMRQMRLALGRNASRVDRVLLLGGTDRKLAPPEGFEGMYLIGTRDMSHGGLIGDAARIYLVDPNGNVMIRWPAHPDMKRMLKDLERLLKASQIG
jgi:hypothetical protein